MVSIARSLGVAGGVSVVSLLLGLPLGVAAGMYRFRGRSAFLALIALPLLVPSFLWAIGISNFRFFSGAAGCIAAFSSLGLSLVTLATLVATRAVTKSQSDSLRIAGSERWVLRRTALTVLPFAAMAAIFAGILTLSDPGPGQILGFSGAASEILVSFAALYDFGLAARQCISLALVVLVIALPLCALSSGSLAAALLGRSNASVGLREDRTVRLVAPALSALVVLTFVILPIAGLLIPDRGSLSFLRAWNEAMRTLGDTIIYAATAAVVASIVGFALAFAVGRNVRRRAILLVALLVLFCLPPSLSALSVVYLGSASPAAFDLLFRSRLTVGLVLGFRLVPIACLLALRSVGTASPSWAQAAKVHGVTRFKFTWTVLVPWLRNAVLTSLALVALLATAEIGTVVLLRPPGADSFPVSIFTVMANAPESLVSAMCLIYVLGAAVVLMIFAAAVEWRSDVARY